MLYKNHPLHSGSNFALTVWMIPYSRAMLM
jgi:hypothetical protein